MKKFLLLVSIVIATVINAQEKITTSNFKTKIQKGVTVVEFNAPFNKSNNFKDWKQLEHCEYYTVCIHDSPELKKKHKIISFPTLIIFRNGFPEKKFRANIMLELDATVQEIQEAVDELYLDKF
jgi:hypothetical protein